MNKALHFLFLSLLQSSIGASKLALDHGYAANPLAQDHLAFCIAIFCPRQKVFLCPVGTVLSINWNNTIWCFLYHFIRCKKAKPITIYTTNLFVQNRFKLICLALMLLKGQRQSGFLIAGGFSIVLTLLVGEQPCSTFFIKYCQQLSIKKVLTVVSIWWSEY